MEPPLEYCPLRAGGLTPRPGPGRGTVPGGQFDWGGRLPKCNGGARKVRSGRSATVPRAQECKRARYSGDNRLILPKSPHRRQGLAPRCRLIASWGWSRSQGLGCSPIKAVRELGSERRETVRSLSSAGARGLRRPAPSTRGPGRTDLRWLGCRPTALPTSRVRRG